MTKKRKTAWNDSATSHSKLAVSRQMTFLPPTGVQQGNILTNTAIGVSDGLFAVTLDFGGQFPGAGRWLEIGVRTNSGDAFTTLSPRQKITPTPYAITAGNVVSGGLATGSYGNAVSLNNAANQFTGTFSGNGANVTNVNAATLNGLASSNFWQLSGNAGTAPGTHFLGTTDNKALTLKVNNVNALQIVPGKTLPNLVGGLAGFHPPVLASGVSGAVIAGGNAPSGAVTGFGGGDFQAVYDNNGTIGGGFGNKAGSNDGDLTDAAFATVGGGVFNSATNYAATVGGGDGNLAGGSRAFVGGGFGNATTAHFSLIGGGQRNAIQVSDD
jgi:trimeric autotransporter adhesin